MVYFMFSVLRWEVIVRFVDIGEIVDHHCLNFLFIVSGEKYNEKLVPDVVPRCRVINKKMNKSEAILKMLSSLAWHHIKQNDINNVNVNKMIINKVKYKQYDINNVKCKQNDIIM